MFICPEASRDVSMLDEEVIVCVREFGDNMERAGVSCPSSLDIGGLWN